MTPSVQQAATTSHLSRQDWLDAGLRLLIEEGVEAVRITRLAEALGVTRGSFYWHFKDRGALLQGLIEVWSAKNTAAVLESVEDAVSLAHGILALFEVWIDPQRFDPRLDQAMRDWARRSSAMRDAVAQADDARVEAITPLFQRFGYKMPEAFIRARIVYFTQVGYYALDLNERLTQRLPYLETYYEGFTGREMASETAEAFRKRHGVPAAS